MTVSKTEKIEKFKKEIERLSILKSMSFTSVKESFVPATNLLPDGFLIELQNNKKRMLKIELFSIDDKELVSVNIKNLESDEAFSLINWLKYKNAFKSYDEFRLTAYNGSFSERLSTFALYLNTIFSLEQLKLTLNGDCWDSVPFDWSGMK